MRPIFDKGNNNVVTDFGEIPWDVANNRPQDWWGGAGRIWEKLKEKYEVSVPDPYVPPPPTSDEMRIAAFLADADRQGIIDKLTTANLTQIEAYIRNKIAANSVTNQETAKQCLQRVETVFVFLMKAIALSVRGNT